VRPAHCLLSLRAQPGDEAALDAITKAAKVRQILSAERLSALTDVTSALVNADLPANPRGVVVGARPFAAPTKEERHAIH
jgi:hypothetical protein